MAEGPQQQVVNRSIATRFQPGKSGNPGGRPKGRVSLTAKLREVLDHDDGKIAQIIIEKLIELALASNLHAIREVFDRIDGKPTPIQPEGAVPEARDVWESICESAERLRETDTARGTDPCPVDTPRPAVHAVNGEQASC